MSRKLIVSILPPVIGIIFILLFILTQKINPYLTGTPGNHKLGEVIYLTDYSQKVIIEPENIQIRLMELYKDDCGGRYECIIPGTTHVVLNVVYKGKDLSPLRLNLRDGYLVQISDGYYVHLLNALTFINYYKVAIFNVQKGLF